MPLDYHTVETVDGATPTNRTDRVILGFLPAVANQAGAGAGDSVQVTISGLVLPSAYNVQVTPGQACVASVTPSSKGFGGFTVTLTPLSSSQTISADSIDILVTA
jgi:hypothetical protein